MTTGEFNQAALIKIRVYTDRKLLECSVDSPSESQTLAPEGLQY